MSSLIPRNLPWHGLARMKPRGWFHHFYWFITLVQNNFRRIFFFFFSSLGSSEVPTVHWQGCRNLDHTKNTPWQFWNPKKRRYQHTFCPQICAQDEFWCKCVHLEVIKQLEEGVSLDFPLLEITSSWSYLLVFIQAESTLILICGFYFPRLEEKIPQMWSQSGSIISVI